ncbi:MAG: M4 family metallopeptidase [Phycisphaerae bacterium]|nr:M4 family metallopeptidase [Phycisphaerae bacterium]
MCHARCGLNCIVPPHLLRKLLESRERDVRESAMNTLLATTQLRGERFVRSFAGFLATPASGRRTMHDCQHSTYLPFAVVARTEDGAESDDHAVNRAFDGLGHTRRFYQEVLNRNSIDGRGMRLDAYVHYGVRFTNAFWNGEEMIFGDGDDIIFTDFTKSLDVIAHELAHGVTQHTANLEYHNQPGALNESISDVFGSLVKQWMLEQTVEEADWLIGSDIFTPGIEADAIRSLKAPGKAYDNEMFGRDPQPDHMSRYVVLPDTDEGDHGGVHINSGIPNRAFYLFAAAMGGCAWEAPGRIWYNALLASNPSTQFQEFADTTHMLAGQMYSAEEQQAVAEAWREVGITVSGIAAVSRRVAMGKGRMAAASRVAEIARNGGNVSVLSKQYDALAARVRALESGLTPVKQKV